MQHYMGRTIVVGDARTGKSSLLYRYAQNNFLSNRESTLGIDLHVKEREIDNKYSIKVQIWDTAGQERFNAIIEHYFRDVTCAVLVYDISNKDSMNHIEEWISKIQNVDQPGIFYLIGNKSDLVKEREVTYEEGLELSKKINARFFETSAKNNAEQCVNKMFDSIFADMYNVIKYNPEQLEKYHIKLRGEIGGGIPIAEYVKERGKSCCGR